MTRLLALIFCLVASVTGVIALGIGALANPSRADAWLGSGALLLVTAVAARIYADMIDS